MSFRGEIAKRPRRGPPQVNGLGMRTTNGGVLNEVTDQRPKTLGGLIEQLVEGWAIFYLTG